MRKSPHNVATLKNSNRAQILECVRRGPISRIDISRQTGISKPSVTLLTGEMIGEGLLCETGLSARSAGPGRTSILIDLNGSYAFAVGVALHRRRISVCLTDIKAQCLTCRQAPVGDFADADAVLDWAERVISGEIARLGLSAASCVGIGISSPGPLSYRDGIILEPPGLPLFHRYPLVARFRQRFSCPVYLENNAVTLSMTDFYRRGGISGNSLFVVVDNGIGSTLLQDGRVFRGAQGFAGELGHISVDPGGDICSCGNRGCLEQYASLSALRARFGFDRYETVVEAALAGNTAARGVLEHLAVYMGTALVSAANLYDPDTVVLYGEYAYKAEVLTGRLEEYIRRHSLVCRVHPVTVLPSVLTAEASYVSAVIPALNAFFAQDHREEEKGAHR